MLGLRIYRSVGGNWLHHNLEAVQTDVFKSNYLKVLPGFRRYSENQGDWEELPPDVEVRACYQGNAPIKGVPPLQFRRGACIYGQHMDYPEDGSGAYRVQHPSTSPFPYQYRNPSERMPVDEAWSLVEKWFPKVDRRYLQLLVCARGYAEAVPGMPAIIIATGNSGAGKTTVPFIAASFCDDKAFAMSIIDDAGRWEEAFGAHSRDAGIICLDEYLKMDKPAALRERLISLRREFAWRQLYVGPCKRLLDNVIVVTGITVPETLTESEQLGRRVLAINLEQREMKWENARRHNIIDVWRHDTDRALAADSLVSHITDEYFSEPRDLLTDIAPALGVDTLRDAAKSGEGVDIEKALRKLMLLMVEQGETEKGKGWVEIDRHKQTPLVQLWSEVFAWSPARTGLRRLLSHPGAGQSAVPAVLFETRNQGPWGLQVNKGDMARCGSTMTW